MYKSGGKDHSSRSAAVEPYERKGESTGGPKGFVAVPSRAAAAGDTTSMVAAGDERGGLERLRATLDPSRRALDLFRGRTIPGFIEQNSKTFRSHINMDYGFSGNDSTWTEALTRIIATIDSLSDATEWDRREREVLAGWLRSPTSAVPDGGPDRMEMGGEPAEPVEEPPAVLGLLIDSRVVALDEGSADPLIWACAWLNKTDAFQPLLQKVRLQRRPEDGGWPRATPDNVAMLVVKDKKQTQYAVDLNLVYVKALQDRAKTFRGLIFELCNAALRPEFRKVEVLAAAGDLGCAAFAYSKETLEALTEAASNKVISEIIGLTQAANNTRDRSRRAAWPITVTSLQEMLFEEENLKLQLKAGHTSGYFMQWLKDGPAAAYFAKNPDRRASYEAWFCDKGVPVDESAQASAVLGALFDPADLTLVAKNTADYWVTYRKILDKIRR